MLPVPPGARKRQTWGKVEENRNSPAQQAKKKKRAERSTNLLELDSAERAKQKKCGVGSFPASCRADPAVSCGSARGRCLRAAARPAPGAAADSAAWRPAARADAARLCPGGPAVTPPEPRRPRTYPRLVLRGGGGAAGEPPAAAIPAARPAPRGRPEGRGRREAPRDCSAAPREGGARARCRPCAVLGFGAVGRLRLGLPRP